MTVMQQIKAMTGKGLMLGIREGMHGGVDIVVSNKAGRHLWYTAAAETIEQQDDHAVALALQECERELA